MHATVPVNVDWSDAADRGYLLSIYDSTLSLYAKISLRQDIELSAASSRYVNSYI